MFIFALCTLSFVYATCISVKCKEAVSPVHTERKRKRKISSRCEWIFEGLSQLKV